MVLSQTEERKCEESERSLMQREDRQCARWNARWRREREERQLLEEIAMEPFIPAHPDADDEEIAAIVRLRRPVEVEEGATDAVVMEDDDHDDAPDIDLGAKRVRGHDVTVDTSSRRFRQLLRLPTTTTVRSSGAPSPQPSSPLPPLRKHRRHSGLHRLRESVSPMSDSSARPSRLPPIASGQAQLSRSGQLRVMLLGRGV